MQFPRVVAGVVCVLAEVLAARPFDWQCYPVDAQINLLVAWWACLPRPPPQGLTCALKGADVHHRSRCRYSVPIRVGRARNSVLRTAHRKAPDRDSGR